MACSAVYLPWFMALSSAHTYTLYYDIHLVVHILYTHMVLKYISHGTVYKFNPVNSAASVGPLVWLNVQ